MDQKERIEYWMEHIARWEESGKSRKRYCADEGISYWTFREWHNRLKEPGQSRKDLVRVPKEIYNTPEENSPTMMDVIVNKTITIRVYRGFDGELLRKVLDVLGASQ
jgi:hypothetical protein